MARITTLLLPNLKFSKIAEKPLLTAFRTEAP